MRCNTLRRVSSLTAGWRLSTRDTVPMDTPTSRANWRMVMRGAGLEAPLPLDFGLDLDGGIVTGSSLREPGVVATGCQCSRAFPGYSMHLRPGTSGKPAT